jgi:MoaA/NifB/PqqE/SkfB family radical SAM enzyme
MPAVTSDAAPLAGRPFVVVWRVLDRCNLSCPFCAYDKRLAFPRRQVDGAEVRRVVGILGALQRRTGRPHLISWLGGEPTLWRDLPDVSAMAQAEGLVQSLTTNGTTLGSPAMRQLLINRFNDVTISVDGFADVHDGLRGWAGAFLRLERWVQQLRDEAEGARLRLRANVVLMRRNLGSFAALCHRLADWGITEVTFNQLGGRDRPEFHPANRLRPEDAAAVAALVPGLRQALAARGVMLLGGDPYLQRIQDSAEDIALPIRQCGVARDFWFIDEAGVIAPCNFVEAGFGLRTHDLPDVEAFAALSDSLCALQTRNPAPACANCMSTQQFSKFAA